MSQLTLADRAQNFIQADPPSQIIDLPNPPNTTDPPIGLDARGYLFTMTHFSDQAFAFDVANKTFVYPQSTVPNGLPNVFQVPDLGLASATVTSGTTVGFAHYAFSSSGLKEIGQTAALGPAAAIDSYPDFATANDIAGAYGPQGWAVYVQFGANTNKVSNPAFLGSVTPVDVTIGSTNFWVASKTVPGAGTIQKFANQSAQSVGSTLAFTDGEPMALGGGDTVDTTSPGAIVMLVKTATAGELRVFPGGNLAGTPSVIGLQAEPVAMKVFAIDNVQYAWVAVLAGNTNLVRLYNLATAQNLSKFDIDLKGFHPLFVTTGVPGSPPDSDPCTCFLSTANAFLHVLVGL